MKQHGSMLPPAPLDAEGKEITVWLIDPFGSDDDDDDDHGNDILEWMINHFWF